MPVCLTLAAVSFAYIPLDHKTLELTNDHIGWPAYVVLVAMILFVASYAAGLGCVPWQANEFLPMEVRAMGTTLINICNWGPNIVVARYVHTPSSVLLPRLTLGPNSTFLSMMKGMTPSGTFGFYAGLCTLGFIFVYFCVSTFSAQRPSNGKIELAAPCPCYTQLCRHSQPHIRVNPRLSAVSYFLRSVLTTMIAVPRGQQYDSGGSQSRVPTRLRSQVC